MSQTDFTEPQKREQAFYDDYFSRQQQERSYPSLSEVLYCISGAERRPYNIAWEYYGLAKEHLKNTKMLEMGCGTGEAVPMFASLASEVYAFDIAPQAVELAQERAAHCGFANVQLTSMSAEKMTYAK